MMSIEVKKKCPSTYTNKKAAGSGREPQINKFEQTWETPSSVYRLTNTTENITFPHHILGDKDLLAQNV